MSATDRLLPGECSCSRDCDTEREEARKVLRLLENGLQVIATSTYPARYIGRREDGMEMYGGSEDASRYARSVLEKIA